VSGEHGELPVAARVRRLEERMIAAGLATDTELDEILEQVFGFASPVNGARMVARAWKDPAYRDRLLADGNAAAAELGLGAGAQGYLLKAVENTPAVHNMIVCPLCSCYPTALLGPSPSWYKSFAYRSRAVREPRAVLAEFGLELPESTEIRVWDANSEAATWSCRCARKAPGRWTKLSCPPSSRGTGSSVPPPGKQTVPGRPGGQRRPITCSSPLPPHRKPPPDACSPHRTAGRDRHGRGGPGHEGDVERRVLPGR